MKYRKDKNRNEMSVLGFGCMRFKKKMGRIQMEAAERQIMKAYNNGVNYFDTAFIYPGSESAIGEIFEKNNIRDKVYIATKLPPQLMRSIDILDKLFNEQLKRLHPNITQNDGWYVKFNRMNKVGYRQTFKVSLHYIYVIPLFNLVEEGMIEGYAR